MRSFPWASHGLLNRPAEPDKLNAIRPDGRVSGEEEAMEKVTSRRHLLRQVAALATALLGALCASGCSDDDGGMAACDWFRSNNCWKQSVNAAASCGHDYGVEGTLAADGMSCTYPDGTEVLFAESALDATGDNYLWDFEVTQNGQFCMSYTEHGDGASELVTSLGTYSDGFEETAFVMNCPDGGRYVVHDTSAIMNQCADDVGGYSMGAGITGAYFTLNGGSGISVDVFNCRL